MVDYHKPSMSISQKVYDVFDKIAVIDHHRRGDEFPDKPLLTYIESTASSASELVAELIQYRSTRKTQIPIYHYFFIGGNLCRYKEFLCSNNW